MRAYSETCCTPRPYKSRVHQSSVDDPGWPGYHNRNNVREQIPTGNLGLGSKTGGRPGLGMKAAAAQQRSNQVLIEKGTFTRQRRTRAGVSAGVDPVHPNPARWNLSTGLRTFKVMVSQNFWKKASRHEILRSRIRCKARITE